LKGAASLLLFQGTRKNKPVGSWQLAVGSWQLVNKKQIQWQAHFQLQ
jgi:hypothetical protein